MMNAAETWFLKSEDGQPLGQVYRDPGDPPLIEGAQVDGIGQIVRFTELGASCGMRRFEVIVRRAAQPAV
jgi:hypothetical protein